MRKVWRFAEFFVAAVVRGWEMQHTWSSTYNIMQCSKCVVY